VAEGGARVDRWLWAVRLFKTRNEATDACRGGHVRVNGRPAKAAAPVAIGDLIVVRHHGTERTVEVRQLLEKRVGASLAADSYVDHTPPPPPREARVAERDRGAGRPTKRERRQLDRWQRR
jgi:ribosome-associated heat shock protein Hsp15